MHLETDLLRYPNKRFIMGHEKWWPWDTAPGNPTDELDGPVPSKSNLRILILWELEKIIYWCSTNEISPSGDSGGMIYTCSVRKYAPSNFLVVRKQSITLDLTRFHCLFLPAQFSGFAVRKFCMKYHVCPYVPMIRQNGLEICITASLQHTRSYSK